MAEVHTFKVSEITKGSTINIRLTGVKVFTWRIRIATWLIAMASVVMPFGCKFEIEQAND